MEEPKVKFLPHGLPDEVVWEGEQVVATGPPTVEIGHRGCTLVLRFARDDFAGAGTPDEVWLRPETKKLTPSKLREFMPRAEEYRAYARSVMRLLGPEGTPKERIEQLRRAAEDLRSLSGPGRGLPPEFYRRIADEYSELVDDGEPHPVKTIARKHNVVISAASHWIKECRRRKLLPPKTKKETNR